MNHISEDFRIQHLSYYKLLIQAGHQEDVLMILDQEQQVKAYLRYPSVSPTPDATRLLALPFAQVDILLPQHSLTFVPAAAYNQEDEAVYGEYLINRNDEDIYTLEIPRFDVQAVYQLDSLLYQRWRVLFPDAVYFPMFQVLLDLVPGVDEDGAQLLIHQYEGHVHVILLRDGEFLFYNAFAVNNEADLGYYVRRMMADHQVAAFTHIWLSNISVDNAILQFVRNFAHRVLPLPSDREEEVVDAGVVAEQTFGVMFQQELCG